MRSACLLAALLLVACDDATGPALGVGEPTGFRIVHQGDVLFAWDHDDATPDTLVLGAGDSIRVEFRFYDGDGERVGVAGASLFVLPGHFDRFHWTADASDTFAGSFVVVPAPDDTRSVLRVQLARDDTILFNTGYLPVRFAQ